MFCKKGVPKNFSNFTGKHLCQALLFNKVAGVFLLHLFYRTPPVATSTFTFVLFMPDMSDSGEKVSNSKLTL